ncbi:hypothetical protein SAMN05421553_2759 [Pseudomonas anguilliseptica]|uniref:Uncharacterized protein n=1 Tax=Pseudomonas anguilliseptica TaxID=53406 RepID=A0A1H5B3M4_PSEAG|nr:hypothetical protein SAMN05421553_2759 [Pseudomonas anguilliseptica]
MSVIIIGSHLGSLARSILGLLVGACRWVDTCAAGSWISPRVIPMGRPGKTGIAAARRQARKARNKRRARRHA